MSLFKVLVVGCISKKITLEQSSYYMISCWGRIDHHDIAALLQTKNATLCSLRPQHNVQILCRLEKAIASKFDVVSKSRHQVRETSRWSSQYITTTV